MAVVFDTNVLISAAFFAASKPSLAVRWAIENDLMLASTATISELASTIERTKFDRYAKLNRRREFVAFISMTAHFVDIRRFIRVCRDPNDDKFLDVAINGGADAIVTGDADLLALGAFEATQIMTPGTYLGGSRR